MSVLSAVPLLGREVRTTQRQLCPSTKFNMYSPLMGRITTRGKHATIPALLGHAAAGEVLHEQRFNNR